MFAIREEKNANNEKAHKEYSRQERPGSCEVVHPPSRRLHPRGSDIQDVRPPNSKAYAILNDIDRSVPGNVPDVLQNYGVSTVLWSRREDVVGELAG